MRGTFSCLAKKEKKKAFPESVFVCECIRRRACELDTHLKKAHVPNKLLNLCLPSRHALPILKWLKSTGPAV